MNTTDSLVAERDEHTQRAFASLAAYAFDLLAVVEQPDLRMIHLNPAGRRLLEIEPDEDPGSFTDFVSSQFLPTLLYEIRPAAFSSGLWAGETALRRRSGAECAVNLIAIGLSPTDNYDACLAIAASDITNTREIKASLQQEQLLLRALLDHTPDSIYFKDLQSRFLRVSSAKAAKTGSRKPNELVGATDFDHFAAEHARKAFDDEQRIIAAGQPMIDMEEREIWPDGRVTWSSTTKAPLHDPRGRVIGTFGISRDITARKETEAKLQATQKELLEASRLAGMAEIASGVLHNIGNALNSVVTSITMMNDQFNRSRLPNLAKVAQMLQDHSATLGDFLTKDERGRQVPAYLTQLSSVLGNERETMRQEMEQLRRSVEHISEIVAMQQNYARTSCLVEDVSPAELVDESLHISAVSLNRHGITVARDFQPAPRVRVTRHKVLQILVNLIRNAKYAMDEASEVGPVEKIMTVVVRAAPNNRVHIIVRDQGVGIPAENLTKIFGFGFTTRRDGHGFGLHSSANAAKELGGSLLAESEGPGKGATFTIDLPAAPAEAAKA